MLRGVARWRFAALCAAALAAVGFAAAGVLVAQRVVQHWSDSSRSANLLLGLAALAGMFVPGALLAGYVAGAERASRAATDAESRERRRSAALLDAAMASSPIGLSILDPALRYVRVNDAIGRITGLAPGAHVGRTLREVNPLLSPEIETALRRVLDTRQPHLNLEMSRRDPAGGRTKHLLLNVYPVTTASGELLGLGVAAVDTTEHRALLEQFHHAQKLEAVGRLAAGITHDFNNLLTVIRSYCDLALLEMPDGAQGRAEIQEIRSAGERAAALSRQLLGMSRKQAIIPRALPVAPAMAEMEPMLRRVTGTTVRLDLRLEPGLGVVRLDPTHLEQVLMNLVINAVDAMPGGGAVTIEAGNVLLSQAEARRLPNLSDGPHVVISVRDTGAGIEESTLLRIFDPFFTTKPQGKGTGLGLSTVYGIVRDAGGAVQVESRVGAGTTFHVYLPASAGTDAPSAHSPAAPDATVAAARGDEIVLVVEDEDPLRTTLARALRQRGYTVLEAAHGGEALRVAIERRARIDLVLSDFHMPGMHGRALVDRLRVERRQLKVLFMSGSSGDTGVDSRTGAGPFAFIAKPFSIDDLAVAVRRVLDAPAID